MLIILCVHIQVLISRGSLSIFDHLVVLVLHLGPLVGVNRAGGTVVAVQGLLFLFSLNLTSEQVIIFGTDIFLLFYFASHIF